MCLRKRAISRSVLEQKKGGIKVLCIENAYSHNTSLRVPQVKGNRLNKH